MKGEDGEDPPWGVVTEIFKRTILPDEDSTLEDVHGGFI